MPPRQPRQAAHGSTAASAAAFTRPPGVSPCDGRVFWQWRNRPAPAVSYCVDMRKPTLLITLSVAVLVASGCRAREVEKDLRLTAVETGWYDVGIVDGQNKIVPTVTFRIQNVSQEPIDDVQINAVFRRLDEAEAWGDRLVRGIGDEGLEPGATGEPLVVRSERGYTGMESRLQMLKNSQFVDAKVELFGKHGSRTWVKMGEYPIDRELITD
jgi:hypothetical protein